MYLYIEVLSDSGRQLGLPGNAKGELWDDEEFLSLWIHPGFFKLALAVGLFNNAPALAAPAVDTLRAGWKGRLTYDTR